MLETTLMRSGRRVLIMPRSAAEMIGRTVVIAWKDSAETARALTAAMPFLVKAERIVVIEVSENGTEADRESGGSSDRLVAGLAWHRIKAEARIVKPGDRTGPEILLSAAGDVGADLVVMGAYGHSRVREMIFGGFTRRVLRAADLPVLMFH
jgi:nucleotide-binding universal stress UspA family protein